MSEPPDPTTAARWYAAFLAADEDGLAAVVAPTFTLHVTGESPLAGAHRGARGLVLVRRAFSERSGGSFRPWREDSSDVAASAHHAVIMDRWVAERGSARLDAHVAIVLGRDEDRFAIAFLYFHDQRAFDRFF